MKLRNKLVAMITMFSLVLGMFGAFVPTDASAKSDESRDVLTIAENDMILDFSIDKNTYIIGKDNKVTVSYYVNFDPSAYVNSSYSVFTPELSFSIGFSGGNDITSVKKSFADLTRGAQTLDIPINFDREAEYRVSVFCSDPSIHDMISFDVKKQSTVDQEDQDKQDKDEYEKTHTSSWDIDQVSNIKMDKKSYVKGTEQKIQISFDVAMLPTEHCLQTLHSMLFAIVDSSFKKFNDTSIDYTDGLVTYVTYPIKDLKLGKNTVTINVRFKEKGSYTLITRGYNEYAPNIKFTVTNPTDKDGKVIDVSDSLRPSSTVYSSKTAANMKVYYSVEDNESDYHLYIRKGASKNGYTKDQKYVVADFMSVEGTLPVEVGKELSVSVNKKEKDFSFQGVYTIVLFNLTTEEEVARQYFYVIPEKFVISRDATKMDGSGNIPFYCDADVMNVDLNEDKTYNFKVSFPINYKTYLETLEMLLLSGAGSDEDMDRGEYYHYLGTLDRHLESVSDDYYVNMLVSYVPEGSKTSRVIMRKKLKGMYKEHEVSFSAKELQKAIYDSAAGDIGYAGVVTVKFTNQTEIGEDNQLNINNDAIQRFTESFDFGVYKSEKLTYVEASPSTAALEFGGSAKISVTDSLGGNIFADVYKGEKKICSLKGACSLNSDGTASGDVYWDLMDDNDNYLEEGKYTVKVHTENEYKVFDTNGTSKTEKVKSEEKSTNVTLKKSNKALTLSARIVSSSGGNEVYVEQANPELIIKSSVGVRTAVKVTNSKGSVVTSGDFEFGSGEKVVFINLSGSTAKVGTYKVTVDAETMDGQTKTVTTTFKVKKLPKASIKNASLKLNGGIGNVSFKTTQYANVKIVVKYGGKVKQTVIDHAYSAGDVKASFSYGGYKVGSYSVVITAKNSGGSRTVTKTFKIKKKPVVVKKPTVSALSVRFDANKDGDTVKGTFSYTGKGAKVIIDIMYNDTEEIVYTYQGKTSKDSGTYSWTWDGFKSNGFRCWPGQYTFRVQLVNSAGKTGYLRQNFELGEG